MLLNSTTAAAALQKKNNALSDCQPLLWSKHIAHKRERETSQLYNIRPFQLNLN